ncbi:MAG: Asp-tRNA(Asn)/Glu-tRNA(Gln) amidotransferase subunit GatB [Candidatus Omnitrophota bacterium]
MKYEAVIGLEVHVQLLTESKVFCGCKNAFGVEPNTLVCPVCLGMPGALPVLNKKALEYSRKTALALNCKISSETKFDRKNYFYPDLPKNFQISQFDKPLSYDGFLEVETGGKEEKIRIKRAHLEEDAGKLIHEGDCSLVDFNRTGTPLLEIVTEPNITSAEQAYNYLIKLKSILRYLGVSDCNMEEGSLRCDANVSIRPEGETELGVKAEVKNLNSFKAVKAALEYEIERQKETLEEGAKIVQETRLWDADKCKTFSMRSKEEAFDYRYFPEPDLPLFVITAGEVEEIKKRLPELPDDKKKRFMEEYGLSDYDAGILIQEISLADYFEGTNKILNNPKIMANWITGPIFKEINKRKLDIKNLEEIISSEHLVKVINLVLNGKINITSAKEKAIPWLMDAYERKISGEADEEVSVWKVIEGLAQISDTKELEGIAQKVIEENKKSAQDYLSGKQNAIMFLVGQVMKQTKGKANPQVVRDLLEEKIKQI